MRKEHWKQSHGTDGHNPDYVSFTCKGFGKMNKKTQRAFVEMMKCVAKQYSSLPATAKRK